MTVNILKSISIIYVLFVTTPAFSTDGQLSLHLNCEQTELDCILANDLNHEGAKIGIRKDPQMTIAQPDVKDAKFTEGEYGQPQLTISLNPNAAAKFKATTSANIGKRLALVAEDNVLINPVIQETIESSFTISAGAEGHNLRQLKSLTWLTKMADAQKSWTERFDIASKGLYIFLAAIILGGSVFFAFRAKGR